MVVRLATKPDGSAELVIKVAANERFPATIIARREQVISKSQVDRLLVLVNEAHFWDMPAWEFLTTAGPTAADGRKRKRHPGIAMVMGGVDWLFEGAQANKYHVVRRKGLNDPTRIPFARLTSYLFRDLAGLEVPNVASQ
jgi:hypothetical protein